MFGLFKNNSISYETYLTITPNRTGEEHIKVMKKYLIKYVDSFTKLNRKTIGIEKEVEVLKMLEENKLIIYGDMTIDDVKDILNRGGEVVDDFIKRAMYDLNKGDTDLSIINKYDKIIVYLENVILKIIK